MNEENKMQTEPKSLEEQLAEQGLITVAAAATRMGTSIYTVYRKLASGLLEGCLVSGHKFVKATSCDKLMRTTSDAAGLKALGKTTIGKT